MKDLEDPIGTGQRAADRGFFCHVCCINALSGLCSGRFVVFLEEKARYPTVLEYYRFACFAPKSTSNINLL